uniref:Uncharacterized protein n=1 Tax=Rhizophora mucronata TaxID=61149 RepID=A0A2P2NDT7_RHIMU
MWPPTRRPRVTAGLRWPPEMRPAAIITATTSACATATANNPTNVFSASLSEAMADPTPANTKRKVTINSTIRACMQSGWMASRRDPRAIFAIVTYRALLVDDVAMTNL